MGWAGPEGDAVSVLHYCLVFQVLLLSARSDDLFTATEQRGVEPLV